MDSVLVSMIVVPGITALLLLLIFAYLYQQSRATYFLVWQAGWAAFCTSFLLQGIIYGAYARPRGFFASRLCCRSRLRLRSSSPYASVSDQRFRFHWYDFAIAAVGHYGEEFIFTDRDVELLQTAAGQVSVAVENARLFEEQQRRARYLIFLNNISKTAISSQDAEQMLSEIVYEIQKNFNLDRIGIGVLDYATKEIEIKAEAGNYKSGAWETHPARHRHSRESRSH